MGSMPIRVNRSGTAVHHIKPIPLMGAAECPPITIYQGRVLPIYPTIHNGNDYPRAIYTQPIPGLRRPDHRRAPARRCGQIVPG